MIILFITQESREEGKVLEKKNQVENKFIFISGYFLRKWMWFRCPVTVQNLRRDVRMWEKSFSEYIKQVFMEDECLCLFIHSPTLRVLLIDQIGTDSESPSAGHL